MSTRFPLGGQHQQQPLLGASLGGGAAAAGERVRGAEPSQAQSPAL